MVSEWLLRLGLDWNTVMMLMKMEFQRDEGSLYVLSTGRGSICVCLNVYRDRHLIDVSGKPSPALLDFGV